MNRPPGGKSLAQKIAIELLVKAGQRVTEFTPTGAFLTYLDEAGEIVRKPVPEQEFMISIDEFSRRWEAQASRMHPTDEEELHAAGYAALSSRRGKWPKP